MTVGEINKQAEPIAPDTGSDGHMSDVATPAIDKSPSKTEEGAVPKNNESSAPVRDGGNADDTDDSWWGEGPPSEIEKLVRSELGENVAAKFSKAYRQLSGAGDNVTRVLAATSSFVSALESVPEDLQMKGAYGELSLAHGRSLVRYVELEGTGSTAVAAKIVKALQTAATSSLASGNNAGDGKGDGDEEEGDDEGDEEGEEDIGNDGDEDEDIETAWTELEVARVIFSREGWKGREAECRYSLGELLLACDEGSKAAEEFSSAAKLFDSKRRQAECYYKKYLALRNADRAEAAVGLKEAVSIYEGIDASDDVFTDMKAELQDLLNAIKDSGEAKAAVQAQQPTVVQVVTPKRKRDVQNEQAASGADGGSTEHEGATNGDVNLSNGKKARMEAPASTK